MKTVALLIAWNEARGLLCAGIAFTLMGSYAGPWNIALGGMLAAWLVSRR